MRLIVFFSLLSLLITITLGEEDGKTPQSSQVSIKSIESMDKFNPLDTDEIAKSPSKSKLASESGESVEAGKSSLPLRKKKPKKGKKRKTTTTKGPQVEITSNTPKVEATTTVNVVTISPNPKPIAEILKGPKTTNVPVELGADESSLDTSNVQVKEDAQVEVESVTASVDPHVEIDPQLEDDIDEVLKSKHVHRLTSNSTNKVSNVVKQKTKVLPITVNLTADVLLDLMTKLGQNALQEGLLNGGLASLIGEVAGPLADITASAIPGLFGPIGLGDDASIGGLDLALSPQENPLISLLGLASELAKDSPPPKRPKRPTTTTTESPEKEDEDAQLTEGKEDEEKEKEKEEGEIIVEKEPLQEEPVNSEGEESIMEKRNVNHRAKRDKKNPSFSSSSSSPPPPPSYVPESQMSELVPMLVTQAKNTLSDEKLVRNIANVAASLFSKAFEKLSPLMDKVN